MSLTDEMDRVRREIRGVLDEMRGINPKTSTYQRLAEKARKLNERLSELGAQRLKQIA